MALFRVKTRGRNIYIYLINLTKNAIKVSVPTKVGAETRATTERLIFEGVPLLLVEQEVQVTAPVVPDERLAQREVVLEGGCLLLPARVGLGLL